MRLRKNRCHFVAGHAAGAGGLKMVCERGISDAFADEGADCDDAARLRRERGVVPHFAEEHIVVVMGELRREIAQLIVSCRLLDHCHPLGNRAECLPFGLCGLSCVCIGLLQMRLWACLDTACEVFRGEFGRHPVVEIGFWINAESVMMWFPCISSCSPQHSVLCGASPLGWHPAVFAFDNFTVGLKVHLKSKRDTPKVREGGGKGGKRGEREEIRERR